MLEYLCHGLASHPRGGGGAGRNTPCPLILQNPMGPLAPIQPSSSEISVRNSLLLQVFLVPYCARLRGQATLESFVTGSILIGLKIKKITGSKARMSRPSHAFLSYII